MPNTAARGQREIMQRTPVSLSIISPISATFRSFIHSSSAVLSTDTAAAVDERFLRAVEPVRDFPSWVFFAVSRVGAASSSSSSSSSPSSVVVSPAVFARPRLDRTLFASVAIRAIAVTVMARMYNRRAFRSSIGIPEIFEIMEKILFSTYPLGSCANWTSGACSARLPEIRESITMSLIKDQCRNGPP
ncbi:MAG: hypothetical protein BJ554DRAFT_6908 [Olpidium bornovanus]|uniref:Uncharacterized protein n=1 Tax=Olpidium bornovanus TaxID=278681 RepID=A0A8H7ZX03_9FUNG|nr:MAG: hypothetical protein BJ554DRAFT_6908 [Olpidium bornovanus]